MAALKRIICTVTNDLTFDQRMQRICNTLAEAGYSITLVGRALPTSLPLPERPWQQVRLRCRQHKGFAFYAEFNLRLFFFLLKTPFDAVAVTDTDTLLAGTLASLLRQKQRVFDAHEYFTEVPEVVHRPLVKTFWKMVERLCLPFYRYAYTVGPALAAIFTQQYGIPFAVVRNMPFQRQKQAGLPQKRILLYQGALNEGRGIETAIAAMPLLPDEFELHLAGEGDLSDRLRRLATGQEERIHFHGYIRPEALRALTDTAWIGINLLEHRGQSYYYSLANKFFDYVQARVPVVTMKFPEYAALQREFPVALLMDTLDATHLAQRLTALHQHPEEYLQMQSACDAAAGVWHWENEKKTLLNVWGKALPQHP